MSSNPHLPEVKRKNASISAYEMHVTKFTPDSQLKNFTFRGDKTLQHYLGMTGGYAANIQTELQALLLKYQNSHRILDATIYDNTGNPIRVVIIKIVNRVVVTDLTGAL